MFTTKRGAVLIDFHLVDSMVSFFQHRGCVGAVRVQTSLGLSLEWGLGLERWNLVSKKME